MKAEKLRTRCDGLLRKVRELGPAFKGSLAQVALTCGKKNCRCRRGERHQAYYVSYRSGGRAKVWHVPARRIAEVRRAHSNWLRLKRLLERMADLQVSLWKEVDREEKQAEKEKRRVKRGKARR